MLRFCRRMLRHEEDARDLAQDVLLRAARGIDSFDEQRPFSAWIYRIGRNACLNHLEREKHRKTAPEPKDAVGRTLPPDVLVARREEVALVRTALAQLPGPDRKLLEMKLVRGLSNAEMAKRLGLAPGALRTRACRALGRLRAAMDGTGTEVRR
jgi:RNA polymerase sigma factor (sigma-70 family)